MEATPYDFFELECLHQKLKTLGERLSRWGSFGGRGENAGSLIAEWEMVDLFHVITTTKFLPTRKSLFTIMLWN